MNKSTLSHDRWTAQNGRDSPNGGFWGCATDACPTGLGRFLPCPWAHQGDQIWLFQRHQSTKRESRWPYCGSFQGLCLHLWSWWTLLVGVNGVNQWGEFLRPHSLHSMNNKNAILQQSLALFHHPPDKWCKY